MLQKRQPALAGTLREIVTLRRQAQDANGDRLGGWVAVFDAPARVVSKTRGEAVLQQRIAGVQPVEVTLRLDLLTAAIDTDWRLGWLGWDFEITAVAVDELAASVSLLATQARDTDQ
jgi:hypothetical protein